MTTDARRMSIRSADGGAADRIGAPGRGRLVAPLVVAATLALLMVGGASSPAPVRAESGAVQRPAAETTLLTLTNQARAAAGFRALKRDATLTSVGRWRSSDMLARDYFSHEIPPSGKLVFRELDRRRYCYKVAGENIGWNTYPDAESAGRIQQSFMGSAGHRANIMGRSWDAAGIGAYLAPSGRWMYTVLFAQRCTR